MIEKVVYLCPKELAKLDQPGGFQSIRVHTQADNWKVRSLCKSDKPVKARLVIN